MDIFSDMHPIIIYRVLRKCWELATWARNFEIIASRSLPTLRFSTWAWTFEIIASGSLPTLHVFLFRCHQIPVKESSNSSMPPDPSEYTSRCNALSATATNDADIRSMITFQSPLLQMNSSIDWSSKKGGKKELYYCCCCHWSSDTKQGGDAERKDKLLNPSVIMLSSSELTGLILLVVQSSWHYWVNAVRQLSVADATSFRTFFHPISLQISCHLLTIFFSRKSLILISILCQLLSCIGEDDAKRRRWCK